MRLRSVSRFLVPSAAALCLFAGCLLGTETTNPRGGAEVEGLHGAFVDLTGGPRAGVKVRAIPAGRSLLVEPDSASAAPGASTTTDGSGTFRFLGLAPGAYNILGDYRDGALVARILVSGYEGGAAVRDLGVDTLRSPGWITGKVVVDGKGKASVQCYIPGTSFLSFSDALGQFSITGVPKGIYTVHCAYLGYPGTMTAIDTGVVVKPGDPPTSLAPLELVYDTADAPPTPSRLEASYDTVPGVVTLRWNRPKVADLAGFVVYRNDPATGDMVRVNGPLVLDTVYRDTLYRGWLLVDSQTVTFSVKSQDSAKNKSNLFSPTAEVKVVSPGSVRTFIAFETPDLRGGVATLNDTVRVIASYSSVVRGHRSLAWKSCSDGKTIREVRGGLPRAGLDTLVHVQPTSGTVCLRFEAEDSSGDRWSDSLHFEVIDDLPKAHAGREAMVPADQPVLLTGRGEDLYGTILQYAWDFEGDGRFDDSSKITGVVRHAFPAGAHTVVLRVTDDDGNRAYDTLAFIAGHPFVADTVKQDLILTAAGGPYSIGKPVVVASGAVLTLEPGVQVGFGWEGRLDVYGSLVCKGTSRDSIRFLADTIAASGTADPQYDRPGGIDFFPGSGSRTRDSTYLSGSIVRFASFRGTGGIWMHNTSVAVEDCAFRDAAGVAASRGSSGVVISSQGLDASNAAWICRRNQFDSCLGLAIGIGNMDPRARADAFIVGNRIRGNGIQAAMSYVDSGSFFFEDNSVTGIHGTSGEDPMIGLDVTGGNPGSSTRFRIRGNTFRALSTGLVVSNAAHAEVSHNILSACDKGVFEQGLIGRFHHNLVEGGVFESNSVEARFTADSNSFDPYVRFSFPDQGAVWDFRNNYWGAPDPPFLKSGLSGKARYEPYLTEPPPGVGLTGREEP